MFIKLIKYVLYDLIKSVWVLGTLLFFALVIYVLVSFGKSIEKVMLGFSNVSSLSLPLFSVLLSSIYLYSNKHFLEFILSQPVKRSILLISIALSLSISLSLSYLLGSTITFFYFAGYHPLFLKVLLLNLFLIPFFVGFGMLSFLISEDKVKGLGLSLFVWFFFAPSMIPWSSIL